jgi:NADPH-dependent ferric siderophore reductase
VSTRRVNELPALDGSGPIRSKHVAAVRHRPDIRPPWVLRRVELTRREVLPTGLLRLTLGGEQLRSVFCVPGLANSGFDDVLVICLPDPDAAPLPARISPHPLRGPVPVSPGYALRDYTIANLLHDPSGECVAVQIDVVRHAGGRFADWAERAPLGAELDVLNPRMMRLLPRTGRIVAVGDDAAQPALEGLLRHSAGGQAGPSGVVLMPHPPGPGNERLRVERLPEPGAVTARLLQLAAEEPEAYFWLAAESSRVTAWRRALIEAGLAKDQVQFSGYWRLGKPQR